MPISIKSKTSVDSTAVPGVSYVVRSLNKIQRATRDLGIMPTRQRLSTLINEYEPLRALAGLSPDGKRVSEDQRTPEQTERMRAIDAEYEWIEARDIIPAFLRAGIVSVDGMDIADKPATVDDLIESSGPDYDALIAEMYEACKVASGLSPKEIKNSESASTSIAQAETDPTPSSATTAAA